MSVDTARYTNLFQQAALLNADGIECLNNSDGEGAYNSFKRALQVVTVMTREYDDQDPNQADGSEEVALYFWPSPKAVPLVESRVGGLCYYVYDHGLLFAPPSDPNQNNMACCASILILNIALNYQQRGLPKALRLYEQGISVLQACSRARGDSDDPQDLDLHILRVIARNNHTQMLMANGEMEQAKEGIEDLRTLLSLLHQEEEEETTGLSPLFMVNDCDVLQELILNIMLVPGSLTSVVAVAA